MYIRVFIGATVWRRKYGFSFLVLFFLATNVVIDCFSLLNFSTYDLIKHHLLENFREHEKSQ